MSVSLVIDIVLIALVIICAIIGLYRGFARSVLSLIGTFASIIIAALVAKPFASLINAIFGANNFFSEKIAGIFYNFGEAFQTSHPTGLTDSVAIDAANNAHGGIFYNFLYQSIFAGKGVAPGSSLGSTIGDVLGALAVIIIAAMIAFVLIRIIVAILSNIAKRMTQFTILGGIDKFLGFLFGAIKGTAIVGVVFCLSSSLSVVFPNYEAKITPIINETKIAKPVYNLTDDLTREYLGKLLDDLANKLLGTKKATEQAANFINQNKNDLGHIYITSDKMYFSTTQSIDKNNVSTTANYYVKLDSANVTRNQLLDMFMLSSQKGKHMMIDAAVFTSVIDYIISVRGVDLICEVYTDGTKAYVRTDASTAIAASSNQTYQFVIDTTSENITAIRNKVNQYNAVNTGTPIIINS